MKDEFKARLSSLKQYFSFASEQIDEATTIENITRDVSFRGANMWISILAIFIASLGLNVNSTAVIIGAMLISPLMGPIIGMGLAFGIGDIQLLRRAFKNYAVATLISITTATLYFLVSPYSEVQSELLARTTPTLYDVLIAFCGGAAGIIAIATGGKGNVIPGVAIATALMPPLCTAGFGLAQGNLQYFLGAFYLFFINTIFISLATYLGVRLMHFQGSVADAERRKKAHRITATILLIAIIPAAFMTVNIVRDSIFKGNLGHFMKYEMDFNGTSIVSQEVDKESRTLNVVAVGRPISSHDIMQAAQRMEIYHLGGYKLNVIQGTQGDSLMMLNSQNHSYAHQLQQQQRTIDSLQQQLTALTRFGEAAPDVLTEMQILFPTAQSLTLSPATEVAANDSTRRYVLALVSSSASLNAHQQQTMHLWLQQRLQCDSVRLMVAH